MSKPVRYGVGVFIAIVIVFWWWSGNGADTSKRITTIVEQGAVSELVSVSGFVEADNTAHLTFPTAGRISDILVVEGEFVEQGALLSTIAQSRLAAERRAAAASVTSAEAARDELVNGQTTEERAVTEGTVAQARTAWEQTVATELQKVQNALITLRSNGLEAYSSDPEERTEAPTVTGSYLCTEEGSYILEVYGSGSDSGYSFTYTGLEDGTAAVTTDQPLPLGECGLSVQFTENEPYAKTEWVIPIPNTRSNVYTTYLNALSLAEQQAAQNIQAAKETLDLAENTAQRDTAAPRVEALLGANAAVTAAQADLTRIDALIADQSIFAPFSGTITEIDKLPGEIATTDPFITLLAENAFTLVARIPEIDITKVVLGQTVIATFDAKTDEPVTGTVSFVSPIATEIDGVAYFETKIALPEPPNWLRAGLNADIDVVITERADVNILPQRFIERSEAGTYIYTLKDDELVQEPVEVGLWGSDGQVEVVNIPIGTEVIAP